MRRGAVVFGLLVFGFVFLYLPSALLVAYSFNESRLVTVWSGFSTQWYGALLENDQLLGAAWISVKVAALAATVATVLGGLAGLALARYRRFRGRGLLVLFTSAPLVMPDVILGLSSLLLFVALESVVGWPSGRGVLTVGIAHASFAVAYVAVVVQARVVRMDPALEEAAADLGAPPWRTFWGVTVPLLWPALAAGWLLAFTLSFDDLVVASFTSGPGSSTLPMVVYSSVRLGVSPQINALATLLIVTVAVGVLVAGRVVRPGR